MSYAGVSAFLGEAWDAKLAGQWGSQVGVHNASGLERAMADVEAAHMMAVPAYLIRDNQDPAKVQDGAALAYLAYGFGVTLWEGSWSTSQKREWLGEQWTFKARVGTLSAITMALSINDFDIVDLVTPPGGFFVSPDLTVEQENTWISRMPEIRVTLNVKTGVATDDEMFADDAGANGFLDDGFLSIDEGPALYGRQAVYRAPDGTETPMTTYALTPTFSISDGPIIEQIAVPAIEPFGFYSGEDFLDDDETYAYPDDAAGKLYTYISSVDQDVTESATLSITPLNIGLAPLSPLMTRESLIVIDPVSVFADDWILEDDIYLTADRGGDMLADVIHLFDPSISLPMTQGVSFADVDRVGVPSKYAEIMIDTHRLLPEGDMVLDLDGFLDDSTVWPDDRSDIDRACRAVVAGKSLRDTVYLSFEPRRVVEYGDTLTDDSRATDWVANLL